MANETKRSAIVVGAGIGGIASAIRLAIKGYRVRLFEANNFAGGKLSEISNGKYRFDAGPSLFTLPQLVDELFRLAGKDPKDYFSCSKLNIICKYFYPDGTIINAFQDVDRFATEVERKTTVNATQVKRFLNHCRTLYELTADIFLFRSFHRLNTFFSRKMLTSVSQWWKLDAFSTMHNKLEKTFHDKRVVQLFDRYATYNGSNPYVAPATLNVIPHLEHNIGAFFPSEGMYSIVKALLTLAKEVGVELLLNTRVEEIIIQNRKVSGVRDAFGKKHQATIVVSDVDIVYAYELMPFLKLSKKYLSYERSTSALIFYWGITKSFPELELHNILFSNDYKTEFDHLFNKKQVYSDPTVYIFISGKKVAADAPAGCENWFVMINVPENAGQDWDKVIEEARSNILQKINAMLQVELSSLIESERILDPRSIEARTFSYQGSLYGNSSNSMFAAFRRHPNFIRKVKNLYFTGGSVHPGGGIPLCLASAKIVDEMIPRVNH